MSAGALNGVRIIDFGQGAIDPIASSYLADFGSEVIKVESYSKLDFVRGTEQFVGEERNPDMNISFHRYNQNKLGVIIDLKKAEGRELAKKLVSISDVATENFTVGTFDKLGLGYKDLKKVKPDIIMLSCAFAGQTGPYKDFRGQGSVISAMQGLDELAGWPDSHPVSPSTAFSDHYMPWMWALVIIAALEHRRQTGEGQYIDGSSFEGGLDILDVGIPDYNISGRILRRRGNRHPAAAPHGVYRCLGDERWCAITVFTEKEWQSFCNAIGMSELAEDKRFATLSARLANQDELDRLVEDWTKNQTPEDVMLKLQEVGVAAGVVKNAKDMYEDTQLAFRKHFWESQEEGMKPFTYEAPAAILSDTPAAFQRRAPFLGEHNDYVFSELLHLHPEEYANLVQRGVIG
jgi:benzylsuccinate CoA-transferase BbsF subunit